MADTSDTNLHLTCSNFALLRLIAGLTVIYGNGLILTGGPASAFWGAPLARFGLDFLFALSGYLVAGSWERRPRPLFFLGRRLLRVLPGLAGYSVPWRGLRRRANAGYGSLNKPETTPLAYSYHTRDGTQRSSPQPLVPLHSSFDRLAPEAVRSGKGCFQAERCSGRGLGKDNSRRSGLGSDQ